jgi:hypothetical protein
MRIIKVAKLETLYTGVMSPLSVHRGSETPWKGLLERFPIPEGWTTYGHHMTINLGQAKNPELLGKDVSLTVTALGQDENAIALQVESSVPIQGAIPHITLATAPSSEPKQSNNIQNWKPIQPFQLTGTIAEIGSGGKVITDEVRELEEIRIILPILNASMNSYFGLELHVRNSDMETRMFLPKWMRHPLFF